MKVRDAKHRIQYDILASFEATGALLNVNVGSGLALASHLDPEIATNTQSQCPLPREA